MPQITFSARAAVFRGNPHEQQEVKDAKIIRQLHGIHSDDEVCSDYIDPEFVQQLGLTGGRLRFCYDAKQDEFRVSTTYGIVRKPSESEMQRLQSETESQWSDGLGGGVFSFLDNEIPSSSLVMAILNQDPEFAANLPHYTVDAFPSENRHTDVTWSDTGGPDDFLLQDLDEAASDGNSTAQAQLGAIYLQGEIVKDNKDAGIEWLTKSANQNNEFGLIHLASAYLSGEHVEADPAKGESLYKKAIGQGSLLAKTWLGEAYKEGNGVTQQTALAIEMLTEASNEGLPSAMAELGDCYEFGVGVDVDLPTALKWYEASLEAGFDPVEPAYKRVRSQLKYSGGILGRIKTMFASLFGKGRISSDGTNVVMVPDGDPEMQAAVAKAQATLSRFIQALKNPTPGDLPTIKVRFTDGPESELMWLSDVRFVDCHFFGVLNKNPELVQNVKIGDEHKAHPNDVADWMISDEEGKFQGGFTVHVLQKRKKG